MELFRRSFDLGVALASGLCLPAGAPALDLVVRYLIARWR